jgi:hypothetical protein
VCSPVFRDAVDGVLMAAGDAMGAVAGSTWLRDRGLPIIGLSGVMTAAPLARREAEEATTLKVLDRDELADAAIAVELIRDALRTAAGGTVVAPLVAVA